LLKATVDESRFEFSPLRDSNSRALDASLAFDPFGVVSGTATFGYKDFRPMAADLPGFRSPTADVDLSTRFFNGMRLGISAIRDVAYSYEITQPYYIQTGINGSIVKSLVGPFDVAGDAGIQHLAYQDRVGVAVAVSNRVDRLLTFGGGIGFRLARGARLGFHADRTRRNSSVEQRQYDGLRFGASLTYGF
jgi:hypothetical protein